MIKVIDNFFSDEECNRIINFYKYAKWLRQKSKVTVSNNDDYSEIRKSEYIRIFPHYFDEVKYIYTMVYNLCVKEFDFSLWDVDKICEDIKIIKYVKGDFFDWHYDCFHSTTLNRKINFSIQLSDEKKYDGGDIEFFKLNIEKNKKKGTIILYPSFLPHRITMITKGIRYSLVGHINGPSFR